jgi:hypothetical protein
MRGKRVLFGLCITVGLVMACERKGAFAVELTDLNGTWQPDWLYKLSAEMPDSEKHYSKSEYSWGTATSIPNTTFNIDLGDKKPFVSAPGLGGFPITEIKKTGTDEITVKAFRGDRDNPGAQWEPVLVFHFIDKDTIWIESEDLHGKQYGKNALWYRLSGPQNEGPAGRTR